MVSQSLSPRHLTPYLYTPYLITRNMITPQQLNHISEPMNFSKLGPWFMYFNLVYWLKPEKPFLVHLMFQASPK